MESNERDIPAYDAAAALADADASRKVLADRLVTPWWYHLTVGLIEATLVLTVAFVHGFASLLIVGAVLVVIALLVRVYQSRYGVWYGPDQLGPAGRRSWWALGVAMLAGFALGVLVGRDTIAGGWAWIGAIWCLVTAVVFGRRIDRAVRAEIRAGWVPTARRATSRGAAGSR